MSWPKVGLNPFEFIYFPILPRIITRSIDTPHSSNPAPHSPELHSGKNSLTRYSSLTLSISTISHITFVHPVHHLHLPFPLFTEKCQNSRPDPFLPVIPANTGIQIFLF